MAELRWISAADPDGWQELADLFTRRNREVIPNDRPSSAEEWRAGAVHAPADRQMFQLLAVEDGEAVGAAALGVDSIRERRAWLTFLFVVPERRRRGVGSAVLAAVRDVARANGRTLISTSTMVGVPDGARFAERAGARAGLVVEQNGARRLRSMPPSSDRGVTGRLSVRPGTPSSPSTGLPRGAPRRLRRRHPHHEHCPPHRVHGGFHAVA